MWISKKKYMAELAKAERMGEDKYYPYYVFCKRLKRHIEAEQKRAGLVKFMTEVEKNA
jgi:uncharacterized tellurite resistance protein B-like protein